MFWTWTRPRNDRCRGHDPILEACRRRVCSRRADGGRPATQVHHDQRRLRRAWIEASSFRYGLAHETVEEIEVLLAHGDIAVCTPTNAHSDLFFVFSQLVWDAWLRFADQGKAIGAKKFVEINHVYYSDPELFSTTLRPGAHGRTQILSMA